MALAKTRREKMIRALFFVAAAWWVAAQAGLAQDAGKTLGSPVKVESSLSTLTVRITEPAPLRQVLDAICMEKITRCDIAANVAATDVVPAMTASGEWSQVLSQLLDGSRLNYSFTVPMQGMPGYLIVQEASAQGSPPAAGPGGTHSLASQTQASAGTEPSTYTANAVPVQNADTTASAEAAASSEGSDLQSSTGIMLPFPAKGAGGMYSTATNQSSNITPFSDSQGRPIEITITNERPTVLPFADSEGRPLPAPAAIPNQKLEYPVPPTTLTPPKY